MPPSDGYDILTFSRSLRSLTASRLDFMKFSCPPANISFPETEREVIEGSGHTGRAAVLQLLGRRPA